MENQAEEIYYSDTESEDEGIILVEQATSSEEEYNNAHIREESNVIAECKVENCSASCHECFGWYITIDNPQCETKEKIEVEKGSKEKAEVKLPRETDTVGQQIEILRSGASKLNFANKTIPEIFQWTAYDECIQEIASPTLAKRMRRLRLGVGCPMEKEEMIKEAAIIYAELLNYRNNEKTRRDRQEILGQIKDAEKERNKYYTAWKKEITEKELEKTHAEGLRTMVRIRQEELEVEREKTKTTARICVMYQCAIEEKDSRIRKLVNHLQTCNEKLKIAMEELQLYKGLHRERMMI